jgi:uncharacterized repeat protein (TIGR01451 family)
MRRKSRQISFAIGALSVSLLAGCAQAPRSSASKSSGTEGRGTQGVTTTTHQQVQHVAFKPALSDSAGTGGLLSLTTEHPDQARLGSEFSYKLVVTNNSDEQMLHNVVIRQQAADGLNLEKSDPQQDKEESDGASWSLGTLKPGEKKTVSVTASSDKEGEAHLCFSVEYTPAICVTTNIVKPDIQITKQAPEEADLCQPIEFVYTVQNTGSGPADKAVLVDDLDTGLTTISGDTRIEKNLGSLAPGASQEVRVQVQAEKAGSYGTRATVMLDGKDAARSNSTKTAIRSAELELKFRGPETEYIRRPMNYALDIKNKGNVAAHDVTANIALPANLRIVQAGDAEYSEKTDSQGNSAKDQVSQSVNHQLDATHLQWQLANLEPGQQATLRFIAIAQAAKDLEFRASSKMQCGKEPDQQVAKLKTKIIALPALLVFAVDSPDPVKVSEYFIYTIGVLNQGDAPDTNVQVTATLPDGVEFENADGPTKATRDGAKVTFAKLNKLDPNEQVKWSIRVKAKKEGEARIRVEATSDGFKEPVHFEEPTQLFTNK